MVEILLNKQGEAILLDGKAISLKNSPSPSIPTTLGSRIDNKATVVGVLQDHEGNDYVLAVVDAAYRSGEAMIWGQYDVDTSLQNDTNENMALTDAHTGKFNTDLILSTYTPTDYPAFNFARNACSVTIGNNTYYSALPSLRELQMLYNNKDVLDQYDPTASQYPDRNMSDLNYFNGIWSSNERNPILAWCISYENIGRVIKNVDDGLSVCPVICIPLS